MLKSIAEYKEWYREHYGTKPSERLIESFCRANGLPWPPEKEGERKESEVGSDGMA